MSADAIQSNLPNSTIHPLLVDRSEVHLNCAQCLLNFGDNSAIELQHVIKELYAAIHFTPAQSILYVLLSEAFTRALDFSSAIFTLRYAIKLDPSHLRSRGLLVEMLVLNGLEMFRQGNYFSVACHRFGEALRLESSRPKVWIFKAICHVQLKEFKDALECTARAIHTSSGPTADYFILRAKILWAMGLMDQGNKDIRTAAKINKKHPEVIAFTARSFSTSEKLYKLGIQYFENGDNDTALEKILHAIYVTPNDVKLYILLSKIYRVRKQLEESYSSLQQAWEIYKEDKGYGSNNVRKVPIEITKQMNLVYNDMALTFAGDGDYERAIILMNKVIDSERKLTKAEANIDYRFFVNRGDCLRALHHGDDAIEDYQLALRISPNNWEVKVRLSMTYYMIGSQHFNDTKYAKAELALSEAIAYNPKVSEYFAVRGKARYYQGSYFDACQDYKQALALNPSNHDIADRLRQFENNHLMEQDVPLIKSLANRSAQSQKDTSLTIKTSKSDTVEMLLNPRRARSLPGLKNHINSHRPPPTDTHTDFLGQKVTYCKAILPSLNPQMIAPYFASLKANESRSNLQDLLNLEFDTSKDQVWSVMEKAKELSTEYRDHVKKKAFARDGHKYVKLASTAAALKRESQLKSRIAMSNGTALLAGVVSSNNDVFILATDYERPKVRRVLPDNPSIQQITTADNSGKFILSNKKSTPSRNNSLLPSQSSKDLVSMKATKSNVENR